ncbi:uncharacterized protein LOC117219404 [Megalopta genalis]|uniref:uncharacterized protein LOC117219404 n=1 Tax=Megalopta genalis TaxID=115081 RepID=UPI003FCF8073
MKFLSALCIFVIVAQASAASIPQDDRPMYGLGRLNERAADPGADPAAYAEAYANAFANAVAKAMALSSAEPIALPDDNDGQDYDDVMRPRRFTCDVLSFSTKWFGAHHAACAAKCLTQRRWGGSCKNGVCVCR